MYETDLQTVRRDPDHLDRVGLDLLGLEVNRNLSRPLDVPTAPMRVQPVTGGDAVLDEGAIRTQLESDPAPTGRKVIPGGPEDPRRFGVLFVGMDPGSEKLLRRFPPRVLLRLAHGTEAAHGEPEK